MGTENIKPSRVLRYPFQIAGPTFVEITNRYQPKAKPHLSIWETGFIYIQIIAPSLFELRALLIILNHYHIFLFIVKV